MKKVFLTRPLFIVSFLILFSAMNSAGSENSISDTLLKWEPYATSTKLTEYNQSDRQSIRLGWFHLNIECLPEFQALPEQERNAIFDRFIEKSLAIEAYAATPSDIKAVQKAAELGFAKAQFDLGYSYSEGDGVPQDFSKALGWVRKAAEQGLPEARHSMGYIYYEGKIITKNYNEAVRWFSMAAEQGYPEAQFYFGYVHLKGQGVPKNIKTAHGWFEKAAEQGHAEAQYLVGLYYSDYSPVNYNLSVKWFRKAADQENIDAQYSLGVMFYKGRGVPQNYTEAIHWFRKAAAQGHEKAQYNLGVMYHKGHGFSKNDIYAYAMFGLAATSGWKDAVFNRDIIAKKLTDDEIIQAQKIAADIISKIDTDAQITRTNNIEKTPKEPISNGSGFLLTTDGYVRGGTKMS